ncbi:MAG: stage III sporulation protein AE [Firmicutes bacterium]|nr:stage III sporulation protein AE [Bacillota bacterium]
MKRIFPVLLIGLILFCYGGGPLQAAAGSTENQSSAHLLMEQLAAADLDLREINRYLSVLDTETQKYLPRFDPKSWGLAGPNWDLVKIGKGIFQYFLRELVVNFKLLGQLLLLAMALAILQNLKHAFESDTVSQLAFSLCFLVVMGIVVNSFRISFTIARGAITELSGFIYVLIPLLFSLMAAGGGVSMTAIVHPLLISSVGIIVGVMGNLVFPLLLFAGVLGLADYLADGFYVNKLAGLFKSAALGIMGFMMAVFIGIITIRGFAASVADSTALRTAKYVSNTFLPVVGGAFSDTMELASGCANVLKSGIGIYGLGALVIIIIFPLMKIMAISVVYQLASAVAQPLGNPRLADALGVVGATLRNIFGAVAVVGLMFFIALAILVGISNYGIR